MPKGSTYGVIGRNGSGKSTALKLVAGITKPTSGTVRVDGRISALIELGAGFHPEISGRENVFINGIMLGLTKREIQERFDEIVEFAELREFIDAPVKTYSSGMYMRLGFAVAIHVDPDVLLVDEVLAVGDEGFTHKCLDKFAEFRRRGKTILLVTHSLDLVERFCDEALWLDERPRDVARRSEARGRRLPDRGRGGRGGAARRDDGEGGRRREPRRAGRAGRAGRAADATDPADPTSNMFQATEGRWGSREVEITDVAFLDREGQPAFVFHSGDPMSIRLKVRAAPADRRLRVRHRPVQRRRRVLLRHEHLSRGDESRSGSPATPRSTFAIDSLDLVEGTYKLDVAVHKRDGYPYDYHRLLYTFRVKSRTHDVGIYRPRHRWTLLGRRATSSRRRPGSGASDGSRDAAQGDVTESRRPISSHGSVPPARPSSSPTACSICFTSATSATSSRRARSGDALIVGLNSDRSVRANKGAERPITPEAERAEILDGARLRGRRRRLRRGDAARRDRGAPARCARQRRRLGRGRHCRPRYRRGARRPSGPGRARTGPFDERDHR